VLSRTGKQTLCCQARERPYCPDDVLRIGVSQGQGRVYRLNAVYDVFLRVFHGCQDDDKECNQDLPQRYSVFASACS